jgi:flavin reductase (DIM6/NTAB) family NADH-FMN oxidoreductase RutF
MIIDPAALDRRELNGLVNGLVSPRPIAWISSLAADGSRNLAPFSFFNAFSFDPPTIGVGPGSRGGVNKDSLRNIRETGEFVVNLVSEQLAGLANVCSAEFGPDVDEWEVSGVRPATCELVAPARVAEAPASLECLDGLIPKPEVLQLVGRMGGDLWCRTQDTFELPRPGTVDAEALGRHAAALAEGRGA